MASISGLSKLGLPKLSEKMDPEDARALRTTSTRCRSSCNTF